MKIVDEILASFNFDRVHTAMKALDWVWWNAIDEVPNIDELKETAKELLQDCAEHMDSKKDYSSSTGGFVAAWNNKLKEIELSFVLTETSRSK